MTLPERRLVAIEGLPGSGHTELAAWIGDQTGWYAACGEQPISLAGGGKTSLLSPVLKILLDRFEWMQGLVGTDLFRERIITDYLFETHQLWARVLLPEKEWILYQKISAVVLPPAVIPDLVVYLQAPDDDLLDSLRLLNRTVAAEKWRELMAAFNHHFFAYEATPLLVVRTGSSGWLDSETAKGALLRRILDVRGAKTYLSGEASAWAGGNPTGD